MNVFNNQSRKLLLCLCTFAFFQVQAAKVEVTWQEPDNYTDIRSGGENKSKFRKNVFQQLEKHITKLASKLPPELVLKLKVTNLNLAGDVNYNFDMHRDIRIVKHIYWPSIEFEYEVSNGEQVLKTETVKLKDMSFMDRGSSRLSHDSYYYEKRILTDWFDKHLESMIANWQQQAPQSVSE